MKSRSLLPAALVALAAPYAIAATITWDGNGANNTSGLWSVGLNWDTNTVPALDTAILTDVTSGIRTITYDAAAPATVSQTDFNQTTTGATNLLSVQRSALTITAPISLGAAAGTEQLAFNTALNASSLTTPGGVTLNIGGEFYFASYRVSSTANLNNGNLVGNVTVAGGTLKVLPTENNAAGNTATSAANSLTGNLTMSSGALIIDNATGLSDRRLSVTGAVNITGGSVSSTLGTVAGSLTLSTGSAITFNPDTFSTNVPLSLDRSGAQSLSTNRTMGALTLRGTGVKALASSATGTGVGAISFLDAQNTANSRTTFKLDSNFTLNAGAAQPLVTNFSNSPELGRLDLGIDTGAGFMLNLAPGGSSGIWTPNASGQAGVTNTVWDLSGTGAIRANAFNFSTANVTTNVASGTVLEAAGGNGTATNLGGLGTIDANSLFRYSGAATSFATLTSNRIIGDIILTGTGALQLQATSLANAYQNDITLRSGTLIINADGLLGGPAATPIKLSDGLSTLNSRIVLQLNSGVTVDRPIDVTAPLGAGANPDSQRPRLALVGVASTGAISSEITYGHVGAGVAQRLEIAVSDPDSILTLSGQIKAPAGQTAANNVLINGGNSGTGTVELSNATNNFTGGTLVTRGTLLITGNVPASGASPIGTNGLFLADGATPDAATLSALLSGPFTFARATTLGSGAGAGYTGVLGIADTGSGNAIWSGNVNSSNDAKIKTLRLNAPASSSVQFTGVIGGNVGTGSVSVEKTGAGTVQFDGLNTYDGNTTVSAGTLILSLSNVLADTSTLSIGSVSEPTAVLNLPNASTDTVAALLIDGVAQPNGLYDSGNSGGAITGVGKIQVGPGTASPFDLWISTNFPSIPDADNDPSDDPDFDGSSNLLEFALNGNPTNPSINGFIASLIQDSIAPAGNEMTLIVAVRDGATFVSGPNGVRSASVDGITYSIEGSLDLAFPASPVSKTGPSDTAPAASGLPSLASSAWEYHTFKLDASEGLPSKGFLRLKVTQP